MTGVTGDSIAKLCYVGIAARAPAYYGLCRLAPLATSRANLVSSKVFHVFERNSRHTDTQTRTHYRSFTPWSQRAQVHTFEISRSNRKMRERERERECRPTPRPRPAAGESREPPPPPASKSTQLCSLVIAPAPRTSSRRGG